MKHEFKEPMHLSLAAARWSAVMGRDASGFSFCREGGSLTWMIRAIPWWMEESSAGGKQCLGEHVEGTIFGTEPTGSPPVTWKTCSLDKWQEDGHTGPSWFCARQHQVVLPSGKLRHWRETHHSPFPRIYLQNTDTDNPKTYEFQGYQHVSWPDAFFNFVAGWLAHQDGGGTVPC